MRMATLKSKKLQQALQKAKNVGRAEEAVVIDGCSIVLQSLAPASYEAILQEVSELDGAEHVYAYQLGHVCRSIVEIEGVSLRDVEFVEDDVPVGVYLLSATVDNEAKATKAREALAELGISATLVPPDGEDGTKAVLRERHEWVRQQVATWSQEALAVAWRKYADVVVTGEQRAKEKVEFRTPDETDEDKFRRLLSEARELEQGLPPDLATKALDDLGYMHKSTPEELAEVARRTKEWADEQAAKKAAPAPVPEPMPQPVADPVELMRTRAPLNQMPVQAPAPSPPPMAPAQHMPAMVPQQLRQSQQTSEVESRASQIAALESEVDPSLFERQNTYLQPTLPREVPEISKPRQVVDGAGVKGILDRPPVAGINPRFRKPSSQMP